MRSSRVVLISIVIAGWLMAGAAAGVSSELLGVRTSVDQRGTTLFLRIPTPVHYMPAWVGPRTFALDIAGVSSSRSSESQPLQSPLVSNYRLLNYQGAGGKPHLRLELALKEEAKVDAQQTRGGVEITIQRETAEAIPPDLKPSSRDPQALTSHSQRGTVIRGIQVAKLQGSSALEVEISGNGAFEYRTMQLSNPDRLVVDIPNVLSQIRQKELSVNSAPLRSVRVGQLSRSPLVSRVVMDLDSKIPFQVRHKSDALVVTLGDSPKQSRDQAEPPAAVVAEAAPAAVSPKEEPAKSDSLAVTPDSSAAKEAGGGTARKTAAGKPLSPAAPVKGKSLEAKSAKTLSAATVETSMGTPVQQAALARVSQPASPAGLESRAAGATQEPKPKVLLAQQTGPSPGAPAATPPAGQQASRSGYTGEPISVNLKDVDLKDFFRLIHEISGLNLVLDPDVSGVVTIVLDEVPWDQAMDIVMKNNRLDSIREGNVVRIAKQSTLKADMEAEQKQLGSLQVAAELAQPIIMVTHQLNYATAMLLSPTLKKFSTARGDIIPDIRTNTLIIKDTQENIARLEALIQTLDQKSQQVEIEARVVSASRSFARDIGVQLAASGLTGNVVLGGAGAAGASPITRTSPLPPLGTTGLPNQQPLISNQPATGATSGFTFLLTGGSTFALDAIITAAESKGIGKLLSRPKIITQDNIEASVKQGVSIPIQTTINNTISVQYIDAVLRLTVTPHVTAEGTIFLKVNIENSNIDPGIATTPGQFGLDTQAAVTSVLVNNGGTVFFGGVIQNTNRVSVSQVPLLGSIPLVGNLFKHTSTSSTTNELLFFITPRIVQSS